MNLKATACHFLLFKLSGLFYYLLGNLSPYLRSQLRSIQLLAVTKATVVVKYGVNCILESFMGDLKELETVTLALYYLYAKGDSVQSVFQSGVKVEFNGDTQCFERNIGFSFRRQPCISLSWRL